jgi:predicted NAD/FAD-binding protein
MHRPSLLICNIPVMDGQIGRGHTVIMKIAIIGTGISGLGAAYMLSGRHDITVYEKAGRAGGHSRTVSVPFEECDILVDTGFIVFNDRNYPLLTGLFRALGVPHQKSDMSFGVSIDKGWLEYSSSGVFAQKKNLLRPSFYAMLADILRFNRQAKRCIAQDPDMSLQDCLDRLNMGDWFRRYYLLAMGAAIWSCPVETIMRFPARSFVRFFDNHGLLTVRNQPQWYTVSGGSREYIKRLSAGFQDKIRLHCGVRAVARQNGKILVRDVQGGEEIYDKAVMACHANEALALIDDPLPAEREILGAFDYQDNRVVLHGDTDFIPRNDKCRASWVYLCEGREDHSPSVSLSYWMNNLQSLDPARPLIVTLNPGWRPRAELIYDEHVFSHPVFDLKAVKAQERIESIQNTDGLLFCGAWQKYGFHEDGLASAVRAVRAMDPDVRIAWA